MAFLFFWFFFQWGFNRMTQMVKLKAAMTATLILLDQTEKKANNTSFFVFSCQKKMEAEIKRFLFLSHVQSNEKNVSQCERIEIIKASARTAEANKRTRLHRYTEIFFSLLSFSIIIIIIIILHSILSFFFVPFLFDYSFQVFPECV